MHQVLLVPWILLHALVVLNIVKDDLAEAVEIGKSAHLRIKQFGHQRSGSILIVDLRRYNGALETVLDGAQWRAPSIDEEESKWRQKRSSLYAANSQNIFPRLAHRLWARNWDRERSK